jgi:D-arabinose 1-dehydrogenase-like Zn-dependent alcohol dehydrogenase
MRISKVLSRWHGPIRRDDKLPFIRGHETRGIVEETTGCALTS